MRSIDLGGKSDAIKKLLDDIAALDNNGDVFEPWCGNCEGVFREHPDARADAAPCVCRDQCRIFVGDNSQDGDAWAAAGELLELLKRAQPILADLLGMVPK